MDGKARKNIRKITKKKVVGGRKWLSWNPNYLQKVGEALAPSVLTQWMVDRGEKIFHNKHLSEIFQDYLNPLIPKERTMYTLKRRERPNIVYENGVMKTFKLIPEDVFHFMWSDGPLREILIKNSDYTQYLFSKTTLWTNLASAVSTSCSPFGSLPRQGLIVLVYEELFHLERGIKLASASAILRDQIKEKQDQVQELEEERKKLMLMIEQKAAVVVVVGQVEPKEPKALTTSGHASKNKSDKKYIAEKSCTSSKDTGSTLSTSNARFLESDDRAAKVPFDAGAVTQYAVKSDVKKPGLFLRLIGFLICWKPSKKSMNKF